MAEITPPWGVTGIATSAKIARLAQASALGSPIGTFAGGIQVVTAGGGHGVVESGGLLVSQHAGTPAMNVDVAIGSAFIRGTAATDQGVYHCPSTSIVTVAVTAAHASLGRKDLVVASVVDADYAGGPTAWALAVVAGTASGSPADPTIPANSLVLARITVDAAVSSIVNAKIADLRTFASAIGGILRCQSTARPTGISLFAGLKIYEIDTDRVYRYTGSAWAYESGGTNATAARAYGSGTQNVTVADTQLTLGNESYDYGSNFASNRYTAPVAGLYAVKAAVAVTANSGIIWQAGIYVNAVARTNAPRAVQSTGSGTPIGIAFSDHLALAANDLVDLRLSPISGGGPTLTVGHGTLDTYLAIVKIG